VSGPIIVTPPASLEPLAPNELPLGDLDRDRTTDAADAARWLRAMRIPVHTYAVIDDEHRGVGLPRRGWDYLVKTISPHCLRERYGLPVDPMPPERVPGLAAWWMRVLMCRRRTGGRSPTPGSRSCCGESRPAGQGVDR